MDQVKERARELTEKYVLLRTKKDQLEAQLAPINIEIEEIKAKIAEYFNSHNLKTVKYEDIGSITVKAPIPRPKFEKEDEAAVFEFVRKEGGSNLIKPTIHSSTFSSFIQELLEKGRELPLFIEVYYQPSLVYKPAQKS